MSQETDNVNGNPETLETSAETAKELDTHPVVQEDACILKKSPASETKAATEEFLLNEKNAYEETEVGKEDTEPRTLANSESSAKEEIEASAPLVETAPDVVDEEESVADPQVVEVSVYTETVVVEEPVQNGNGYKEEEVEEELKVTNGDTNGVVENGDKVLNGTIANELITEDYKLPEVDEVKRNFENLRTTGQTNNLATTILPKKGALSTNLDASSIKKAYEDVRQDATDTEWAVFKFQGPTIVTAATGADFGGFKNQFGDDERAFGYIRVQTGDEMSRRAKFLFLTWVGPSVSVLKRAKMSTDKAIIKDILSNFAVELQTENASDINIQNFEAQLDKAAGAHYGTGVRS